MTDPSVSELREAATKLISDLRLEAQVHRQMGHGDQRAVMYEAAQAVLFDKAANTASALLDALATAGQYTEAHERLDDLARERIAEAEAALQASRVREERLADTLRQTASFLEEFSRADLDESAADGGVTVGMVYQQQARTVFVPRAAQALSALNSNGGKDE